MFLDARTLSSDETLSAEIAIVGAGAAGITIARELAGAGARILLIESGGLDFSEDTQKLYAGDVVGADFFPLDAERLRYFGGSTNHWDGFCRPLDAVDFDARPYIPHSGWPITRADLEPYYRRAQPVIQLNDTSYEPADWIEGDIKPLPLDGTGFVTEMFECSPPTRFGTQYREVIDKAANITALLDANLVEIETTANAGEVIGLRLATLDGKRLRAVAKHYVLAAGGIETPRLLLCSNKVSTAGLGNRNDLVGRYFMDHPAIWKAATVVFGADSPALKFYDYLFVRSIKGQGCLVPDRELLDREKLPNFAIFFYPGSLVDVSPAAASARTIFNNLRRSRLPDDLGFHLKRIIFDIDSLVTAGYQRTFGHLPPYFSTRYSCECPPDPESRVTLGDDTDALGMRRVKLDWRLPSDFQASFERAHALLAQALGQKGLARLRVNSADTTQDPMTAIENSHHHMGTTRMHRDPKQGVVDENCRVHGVGNLYIAGSSVFPTYGHANPTVSIVALSLRLADHLKAVLQEG